MTVQGGRTLRVTVGLDFGTYSTKVVARPRGSKSEAHVTPLEERPTPGYPCFVTPSLMRAVDGRLYLGGDALSRSGGRLFRSQKVELLPPLSSQRASASGQEPGPDFLVACYLSWALARIRDRVAALVAPAEAELAVNLAAPMSHVENRELKDRYLRIVGAAWASALGPSPCPVRGGERIDDLVERFRGPLAPDVAVPDRADRMFEVMPETVAPLVSMHDDPEVGPGLYVVVDVGAGTSEISVVRLGDRSGQHRIFCYGDVSTRFGGDDFERLREARLSSGEQTRREEELVNELHGHIRRTWHRGRQKDLGYRGWRNIWGTNRVFLVGGGARERALEAIIRRRPPYEAKMPDFKGFTYTVEWYVPAPQSLRAPSELEEQRAQFHLLAVAHGLSFERPQWPRWFGPAQVPTLPRPSQIDRPEPGWWSG